MRIALVPAVVFASLHLFATAATGQDQDISAKEAYEKGDYATALGMWRRDASAGDLKAQVNLGRLYALGHGVAKDEVVAISWFRKAADAGSFVAHHNLGVMYETGSYPDLEAAAKHYRIAAVSGRTESQKALGKLYQHGRGVERNLEEAAKWFEEAADDDDPEAQFLLGVFYANGWGVERDNSEMLYWIRLAARQGYPRALFHVGLAYDQGRGVDRNYANAARFYEVAADKGNVQAQARLGEMHFFGIGVDQSYASAFRLLTAAAEAGDPRAAYVLGIAHHTGKGTEKDLERGIAYYRQAASKGYVDAWNKLGAAYAKGEGVPEDQTKAVDLFRRAANAGSAPAELQLGLAYASGRGVAADSAESARWILKSARRGNAEAQFRIAGMYRDGVGVGRNDQAAVRWIGEAYRRGHPGAYEELAERHLSGTGVARDPKRAVELLREAAENGSITAGRRLARLFAEGVSVDRDVARAVHWYRRLAEKGDAESTFKLGMLHLTGGGGLARDPARAAELLREAANLGSVSAAAKLAEMHLAGHGVAQSHREAAKWYRLAAENGDGAAHVALGDFHRDGLGVDRDPAAAERHYNKALAIHRSTGPRDPFQASAIYRRLGELMRGEGRYGDAVLQYRQAAEHLRDASDNQDVYVDTLIDLVETYRDLGRLDAAARTLSDALEALRSRRDPRARTRRIRLGNQFELMGRYAPAAQIYSDILSRMTSPASRNAGGWIGYANVLAARGRALGTLAYDEPADADFVEALTWMERRKSDGFDYHQANALNDYGSHLLRTGHTGEAVAAFEKAKGLIHRSGLEFHPMGFAAARDLAKGYERQGRRAAAIAELKSAIRGWASRIRRLAHPVSADARAQLEHLERLQREYLTLLTASPQSDLGISQSFEAAQQTEPAALSATLRRTAVRLAREDDALGKLMDARHRAIVAKQRLETRLSGLQAGSASLSRDELREGIGEFAANERELDRLEAELSERFPTIAPFLSLAPMPIAEAQELLVGGEALVTVLEGERHTHVWVVTDKVSHHHRSSLGAKQIGELVQRLRASLEPGRRGPDGTNIPFPLELSAKLYRELFGPARTALKGISHVFFATQGALRNLPLSVLVTDLARAGKAPLLARAEGHEYVAESRVATFAPGQPPPGSDYEKYRDVLWFADKYAYSSIPSVNTLRILRTEANVGRGAMPAAGVDMPVMADRSKFVGVSRGTDRSINISAPVRKLAFAHRRGPGGKTSEPDATFPVLARSSVAGKARNGLLTAGEIAGLTLDADLVVLGASMADAPARDGDADWVAEISRALFHAGTRAVLVSNWPVDQDVAAAFHAAMFAPRPSGEPSSLAQRLQQAVLDLINDPTRPARYAHPAYWGAFAIIGDGTRTQ